MTIECGYREETEFEDREANRRENQVPDEKKLDFRSANEHAKRSQRLSQLTRHAGERQCKGR
jgi:pyruvate/2-oxoacid:ferredoxin oxidoreductase beta subunit